ncbi:Uncharacterized protein DAT39_021420 [Clarias magur]|uniref:Uncharacterized protein n=1 Tax=Clarias magur TaxID=1594786 RepID=A0A8J4U168_CLAMG|nr:Uncharacterized protein DAT39_021420 [Clarias magur]
MTLSSSVTFTLSCSVTASADSGLIHVWISLAVTLIMESEFIQITLGKSPHTPPASGSKENLLKI